MRAEEADTRWGPFRKSNLRACLLAIPVRKRRLGYSFVSFPRALIKNTLCTTKRQPRQSCSFPKGGRNCHGAMKFQERRMTVGDSSILGQGPLKMRMCLDLCDPLTRVSRAGLAESQRKLRKTSSCDQPSAIRVTINAFSICYSGSLHSSPPKNPRTRIQSPLVG